MIRSALLATLLSGLSCSSIAPQEPRLSLLDEIPPNCPVRVKASSWAALVAKAGPTTLVSKTLFLWCRPSDDATWVFELAQPFLVEKDGERSWVLLEEPATWQNSELEGEFVSGRAFYPTRRAHDGPHNRAERVASSKAADELYKISCTTVPGGAHANQATWVVLARRHPDGRWEALWQGSESSRWSMGSYGVNESYEFRATDDASVIRVRETYTLYPSFEGDNEPDPVVELRRFGRLEGVAPMNLRWETSWGVVPNPGESWERIAEKLLYYRAGPASERPRLAAALRDAQGVLPPGFWP